MAPLTVLVAPSGFKESLSAKDVADCIEAGFRRALDNVKIIKAPLVDGGEGFCETLVASTGGTLRSCTVTGPVGQTVTANFGFLGGEDRPTAVMEMAAAAGLRLVPRDCRNPLSTTSFGVGEMMLAAIDAGAEKLLIGCGDSGTSDAGAGMAQALGIRLLDSSGKEISRGGRELAKLRHIDISGLDPRFGNTEIEVACNWRNTLCEPNGVARTFGPQKGASPEAVEELIAALDNFATIVERDLGVSVHDIPGGGASGGLGAGLQAFLKAVLKPRFEVVFRYLEFASLLKDADLVVTAEGRLDAGNAKGKIPAKVSELAKAQGVPVICLAGSLDSDCPALYDTGMNAFFSILTAPCTLEQAIDNTAELLTNAAENVARTLAAGSDLRRN